MSAPGGRCTTLRPGEASRPTSRSSSPGSPLSRSSRSTWTSYQSSWPTRSRSSTPWKRSVGSASGCCGWAPTPAAPFKRLTALLADHFDTPPWQGEFAEVVPHLTVGLAGHAVGCTLSEAARRPGAQAPCALPGHGSGRDERRRHQLGARPPRAALGSGHRPLARNGLRRMPVIVVLPDGPRSRAPDLDELG